MCGSILDSTFIEGFKMKRAILGGALALALFGAGSSFAAVTITNGSFELGSADPGGSFVTLGAGDTSITGWTVGDEGIDLIGGYWQPEDGNRSVDLAGNGPGSITQQLVNLVVGQHYTVNFWLAGNPDGGGAVKVAAVSAGGTQFQNFSFVQGANTRSNMGWQQEHFGFTADNTVMNLAFAATQPNPFGPALDNVSIGVPEPAMWAMMLTGFGGLGAMLRRQRPLAVI